MASQLARLELWDGLDAVSAKVRLWADVPWSRLVMDQREDGDDTLTVTIPLAHGAAASVAVDTVWRVIGEDATVWEFITKVVEESPMDDALTATCAAARSWLNTSAITITDQTITSTPAGILNTIRASSGWPAWATNGTVSSSGSYTVTLTADDTGLSAVLKLVAAIDATLPDGDPPCVMRFRRASDSSYVIDILTTPVSGTAHLCQDVNIVRITRRKDGTTGTSVTSYQLQVIDLYRQDAATYPRQNLAPYETVRLEARSLSLDTSTSRLSQVVTDFGTTFGTTVQIGEPRRRMREEVATVAAETVPPTPVLTIVPGTVTSTTQPYTISATVAEGTVRRQVTPRGCTATGSTFGAISDGASADLVDGEVLTVDRPAQGSSGGSVVVYAFGSYGGSALQILQIEPAVPPILLTITATQTASSDTTMTYDVIAVDPTAVTTPTIADDGGGSTTGPTGDSWVIARPTAGDPPLTVKFTASATDRVSQSVSVVVPAQDVGGGGGTFPPSIDALFDDEINTSSDYVGLTWSASNEPASETYDLRYSLTATDYAGVVLLSETGTVTGITSPYDFGTNPLPSAENFDIKTKNVGVTGFLNLTFSLRMKDSSPAVVATKDFSIVVDGDYVP